MAGDGTNGPAAPMWLAQPAYTPTRKMRVVCIGAGFAGLMVAHKVQHELKLEDEMELAIYERNPEIGGTWYENTYPGAAWYEQPPDEPDPPVVEERPWARANSNRQ